MARARRWGTSTLRAKWTLAVLGVSLAPMVALGLVVLDIQRTGLSRAEKELEAAVVDEAASSVIAVADQASDVGARVAATFGNAELDVDARTRAIAALVSHAPGVAGVSFFDEGGHFVDAVVPAEARNPELVESLRRAPARVPGFHVEMLEDGAHVARYETTLDGAVQGFVVVVVAREALQSRLRELSLVRFGAPDRVSLVDEAREVLAGSARASSIFDAAGVGARSFGTELLLTTEFSDGGVAKVGTLRTMPRQRWALVVERPTDEAFAALASARRAFVLSLGGFAALVVLASFVVTRRILGPLSSLMGLVRRYGRREFDARSTVKSGDEFEALGASLETMADDLSASEVAMAKRARVEENLRRYMPAEAAQAAAEHAEGTPSDASADALAMGGARRVVTVVFADVVAFTGFAERSTPERSVAFLNELFTMLSEIVFRHGGMVDKFIGDCIMAVFRSGDGAAEGDDVARALAAAEDMHAFVASNLPRWREAYAFEVELGIGVSRGEVLMGNLGSTSRMEYTVIGDAVNVAARLEALARPRQTLTTREVVLACPEHAFTSLGEQALRGRASPVEVFEVAP